MSAHVYGKDGKLVESWDDTTRTYTDHRTGQSRPYTAEENAATDARAAQAATLTDLEARVAALEAWQASVVGADQPANPTPDDPAVPTWGDLVPPHHWLPGTLLRDGGKVWRNTSGTIITTPPSGFPGNGQPWIGQLFVVVASAPTTPPPTPAAPEWSATAAYKVGDLCTRGGVTYRCLVAHGPEYQGTWGPPQASVWAVVTAGAARTATGQAGSRSPR